MVSTQSEGILSQAQGKGNILVFLEQNAGEVEAVSLEVLGKAREIADKLDRKVVAVLLGEGVRGAAEDCSNRGAHVVLVAESPLLRDYTTEPYVKVLASIAGSMSPSMFLFGATHDGTTLAATLAVRLHAGLMAHVVDLEIEKETGALLGSVPGFGGSIVAICKCRGKIQMATVRPGVFAPLASGASGAGVVESVRTDLETTDVKQNVVEKFVGKTSEISKAELVVVAGLGCTNLEMARGLADALGAGLAVSRPLADKGMAPKDAVVGSTGSGLTADLVVILGVSGASHFISGIRNAKLVVAINRDQNAMIFKHSDYCVKADVNEVVPLLTSVLKAGGQSA